MDDDNQISSVDADRQDEVNQNADGDNQHQGSTDVDSEPDGLMGFWIKLKKL